MRELTKNLKILIDALGEEGFKNYLDTIEDEKIESIDELNDVLETEISYMCDSN